MQSNRTKCTVFNMTKNLLTYASSSVQKLNVFLRQIPNVSTTNNGIGVLGNFYLSDNIHCKYIRPDYDGTLAIHRSTIVVRTTIVVRSTMNG